MKRKYEQKKMRQYSKTKQLHKKVENLWKEACKKRDGYKCQYCGSTQILQVHHIVSRKNTSTFFDIDNGITLCKNCHSKVSLNPTFRFEFQNFLAHRYGQEFLDDLERKSKIPKKWTILELEELEKQFKEDI